jgi:hypothetical protein
MLMHNSVQEKSAWKAPETTGSPKQTVDVVSVCRQQQRANRRSGKPHQHGAERTEQFRRDRGCSREASSPEVLEEGY